MSRPEAITTAILENATLHGVCLRLVRDVITSPRHRVKGPQERDGTTLGRVSSALIEARRPTTWRDLRRNVAGILAECGYEVEVNKALVRRRGHANVDVYAIERTPPADVIVVECEHWKTLVRRSVVHGFRDVVTEIRANRGFIVSAIGFEGEAVDAAAYTGVRLVDWEGFQEQFVRRWFERYMVSRLEQESAALMQYIEPINSRLERKAEALPAEGRERLEALQRRHLVLSMAFTPSAWIPEPRGALTWPDIPLRAVLTSSEDVDLLPEDVLDARALRPLLDALTCIYRDAIADFEEVLGDQP
jgi:restriction system protein